MEVKPLVPGLETAIVTATISYGAQQFETKLPLIYEVSLDKGRPQIHQIILKALRTRMRHKEDKVTWTISFEGTKVTGEIVLKYIASDLAKAQFEKECLPILLKRYNEVLNNYQKNVQPSLDMARSVIALFSV